MNRFVLAFPIPVAPADVFPLTETVSVAADAKTLLVPGCAVNFEVVRNPPAPSLSGIFAEHRELAAGATGVYMQQSGSAWTADAFREELDDGEFPMDPWINFVESADMLYTLGLEVFNSPDLCISRTNGSPEELRNILSVVADSIFVDGISSKSGIEVDGGECGTFTLRAEQKSPFSKDSPEFNRQGIMRLLKK